MLAVRGAEYFGTQTVRTELRGHLSDLRVASQMIPSSVKEEERGGISPDVVDRRGLGPELRVLGEGNSQESGGRRPVARVQSRHIYDPADQNGRLNGRRWFGRADQLAESLPVGGDAEQRGEVATGRETHGTDSIGLDPQLARLRTQPADGGQHVFKRRRVEAFLWSAVFDSRSRESVRRERGCQARKSLLALLTLIVHENDRAHTIGRGRRQMEIKPQLASVRCGEKWWVEDRLCNRHAVRPTVCA